ncbi:MAG: prepilin-type N-terminal cleavage/methylation domain-containing protein [Thalassovita sp.]
MRRIARRRAQQGLTLIELVVAIAILSIGSLAALRTTDQARLAIGSQLHRVLTDTALRNRTQELQLLGPYANLPASVQVGNLEISISQNRKTTQAGLVQMTVSAKSQAGTSSQATLYLAPGLPGALQ